MFWRREDFWCVIFRRNWQNYMEHWRRKSRNFIRIKSGRNVRQRTCKLQKLKICQEREKQLHSSQILQWMTPDNDLRLEAEQGRNLKEDKFISCRKEYKWQDASKCSSSSILMWLMLHRYGLLQLCLLERNKINSRIENGFSGMPSDMQVKSSSV